MTQKTIKTGSLYRSYELRLAEAQINQESRTVSLAFSSEEPVDRGWGKEILDHNANSVRLGRLNGKGPLLVDHDRRDHIGVVESVSIDADRKGRAVVRFGKGERANEIFSDVVDGVRSHVSVGYRIHKMRLESEEDDEETYRATDWEPYEISIVSMPADVTVGVGRDADDQFQTQIEVREMPDVKPDDNTRAPEPIVQVDMDKAQKDWRRTELDRIENIEALGDAHGEQKLAREFVKSGRGVDEFRTELLKRIQTRPVQSPDLGLSDKEAKRFSFLRAINAMAAPDDRRAQERAAFEREVSEAAAEKMGRQTRGFTVPDSISGHLDDRVKADPIRLVIPSDIIKRDLVVGTATAGGHTVSTDMLSQNFIDMLRNRTVVFQRALQLTGLIGNIAIPRQTGGATAYWVTEGNAPTESQQAFDQVAMSPNTVGAFTDFSRKLMLQSSLDIEAFVRGDLAATLGLEIDRVCINGSGSGSEPEGILNTTGIGSVVGGTNGLAPTWDHIVDLESEVANDNADVGSLVYLTNTKVRGKLKKTFVDPGSGERVWDTRAGDSPLNGTGALVTNQVPSNLTKGTSSGVCSAIVYGNLRDLIVGMWGGLDIMVDPYSMSTSGSVRVVALQDVDVAVRHAQSFAAMVDALT